MFWSWSLVIKESGSKHSSIWRKLTWSFTRRAECERNCWQYGGIRLVTFLIKKKFPTFWDDRFWILKIDLYLGKRNQHAFCAGWKWNSCWRQRYTQWGCYLTLETKMLFLWRLFWFFLLHSAFKCSIFFHMREFVHFDFTILSCFWILVPQKKDEGSCCWCAKNNWQWYFTYG